MTTELHDMQSLIRVGAMLLLLDRATVPVDTRPAAWPLRATVTDLHGHRVLFRAVTLGGDLIVRVGEHSPLNRPLVPTPELRALARGDTLNATTPADYPLDLAHGPVVFLANGLDSIRVRVGHNPFGSIDPVTAQGRLLTVRLANGRVAIEAR